MNEKERLRIKALGEAFNQEKNQPMSLVDLVNRLTNNSYSSLVVQGVHSFILDMEEKGVLSKEERDTGEMVESYRMFGKKQVPLLESFYSLTYAFDSVYVSDENVIWLDDEDESTT